VGAVADGEKCPESHFTRSWDQRPKRGDGGRKRRSEWRSRWSLYRFTPKGYDDASGLRDEHPDDTGYEPSFRKEWEGKRIGAQIGLTDVFCFWHPTEEYAPPDSISDCGLTSLPCRLRRRRWFECPRCLAETTSGRRLSTQTETARLPETGLCLQLLKPDIVLCLQLLRFVKFL